jgi:hypothetical protein
MSSIWLGAIASLSGVIIGAVATHLSQVLLWKRTTRRELYGTFVSRSNVCRDQFLDVAYAIRWNLPEHERNEQWEKANAQVTEVSSLAAQVSMVATAETRRAAEELEGNLSDLKTELHNHNRVGTPPKAASTYREIYDAALRKFTVAASKELGVARTHKRSMKWARRT